MDEPCGPEIASPGFQLQLEHSTTSSQMSQKNSSECGVKLVCSGNYTYFLVVINLRAGNARSLCILMFDISF